MKPSLPLITIAVFAAITSGCASSPWLKDIADDPRLSECIQAGEPLPMKIAVAPVRMRPVEEAGSEKARERFSLTVDPEQIQKSIVESLARFRVFGEIEMLDPEQAGISDDAVMNAAWEGDYDALLSLEIEKFEAFYDGVNGWYIPNIINWLFLLVPSWWVKDEVYGASMTLDATLTSTRSGALMHREQISAHFKRSLNDFQRGWQFAGIFRVPGSLGESNWRRISKRLLPGVLREIQVQTVLGLHRGFRQTVSESALEALLRTRLGVIIGVSRHKDYSIPKLKYTEEDAISVHKYLTDQAGGRIPERNVKLLTDERASKEGILKALNHLAQKARSQDSVIVYFAGYGLSIPSPGEAGDETAGSRPFLVPFDADPDSVEGSCIALDEIEHRLLAIDARELLVILDTSFGGTLESRALKVSEGQAVILDSFLKRPGRFLLLSGRPDEGAMEIDDHRHGIFTYYMLQGLGGPADADKDGSITVGELHGYLEGKVAEETEMEGSAQHPILSGSDAPEMVIEGTP